nr:hypothetical protein [Tanacetum cinerariifolium]
MSSLSTFENPLPKRQNQWPNAESLLANQHKRLKSIIISCLLNDVMKYVIPEDPPEFTEADNYLALNEPDQTESTDSFEPVEPQNNVIVEPISDVQPSPTISPLAEVILQTPVPQERWSREKHIKLMNIIGEPLAGITTRSRIRDSDAASASEMEPKKLIEALEEESWIIAMQGELNQFERNNVWTLVPKPHGKTIIGTKWIWKNKMYENGIVIKNKGRMVAQGYNQQKGIDYEKTFVPVARLEAIKIFLTYAAYMGFLVYQMDVKSAFLNGKISDEVYVQQPPRFGSSEYPNHVCKLDKALYGKNKPPELGSLMYLTASRPDIQLSICLCARYQANLKKSHLVGVKRIFKYLKGTPNLGLWYPKGSGFDLKAYSDSNYTGCNLDKKSTSGGCQILKGKLVCWSAKKQSSVAMSSAEADYVAATGCCAQVLWIKSQLADYDVFYDKWDKPLFFTQDEFISAIGLPICNDVVPLPPKETVRDGLETLVKLSKEPEQSLIPSYREVNADDTADKSLSRAFVQHVTQSKSPTNLKTKKKRIPPSSKPKSPNKVMVILPKKQVIGTLHEEVTVATDDATKSLVASELAKESMPDDNLAFISGFETQDSADHLSEEGTNTLLAFADKPTQSDPLGHLQEELNLLNNKVDQLESIISKKVADIQSSIPTIVTDTLEAKLPDSDVMKGLSKCKASKSNIRCIRVKDIIKEVEDYLKTYSSAGMDIMESIKDMTSKFNKLVKFEGQDFRRCKKKIHFLLTTLKVVYVLSTPSPVWFENETLETTRKRMKWENDDYICRGHILNGMSDSLFDIYHNAASAKALWESLESKYMVEDTSVTKMVDTRPVMEQYHEMLRILGQYTQHNLMMNAISVAVIIDKLPPYWKEFKHGLKHKKEELNLVQLGSHLQIEEGLRNQELDNNPKGKNQIGSSSVNMVERDGAKNSNNNKNKRNFKSGDDKFANKKGTITCWKCKKIGHMKKDCRSRKGNDGTGSNGSKDPEKQKGYNSNFMQNFVNVLHYVSAISDAFYVQDDEVAWLVDSGATSYVCKDLRWVQVCKSIEDGSFVKMGNVATEPIKGIGRVLLTFTSGKTLCLDN